MKNELPPAVKKRLIYAEDLFEPVDVTVFVVGGQRAGKTMAMYEQLFRKRVELAPTIDAVEVVRCKDCEHWSGNGHKKCRLHSTEPDQYGPGADICMEPDDFCSYGERRADHG